MVGGGELEVEIVVGCRIHRNSAVHSRYEKSIVEKRKRFSTEEASTVVATQSSHKKGRGRRERFRKLRRLLLDLAELQDLIASALIIWPRNRATSSWTIWLLYIGRGIVLHPPLQYLHIPMLSLSPLPKVSSFCKTSIISWRDWLVNHVHNQAYQSHSSLFMFWLSGDRSLVSCVC